MLYVIASHLQKVTQVNLGGERGAGKSILSGSGSIEDRLDTYWSVCVQMKIHIYLDTTRIFSGLTGHVRK